MGFNEKIVIAQNTFFYLNEIDKKFAYKLMGLKDPYEEFKVFIHDKEHKYDSDAMELAIRTVNRWGFSMKPLKYKTLNNGTFAYIFLFQRKR